VQNAKLQKKVLTGGHREFPECAD